MREEINLKYRWKRLSGDPETLFHGNDGDRRMGRIEKSIVGAHWLWFMNFQHGIEDPHVAVTLNGASETARQAAAACERCYDAVMSATWPGITQSDVERLLENERERRERQALRQREDAADAWRRSHLKVVR